jgi:cell division protein FtsQ
MSHRNIATAICSVVLLCYLLVALPWACTRAQMQTCQGLAGGSVEVIDPDTLHFVTAEEATRLLGDLPENIILRRFCDLDLDSISRMLQASDKVERVEVMRLNNDKISIRLWPIHPVARVWLPSSGSYYINRAGKRISATANFHMDVPQVTGRITSQWPATRLLPLIDYLNDHPLWSQMVSMIHVQDSTDVLLVPVIRGHVINLGDLSNLDSKFSRLEQFYSEVLPVKGWDYYRTISVKWNGQIVATKRKDKMPPVSIVLDEADDDEADVGTMSTGNEIITSTPTPTTSTN